MNIDLYAGIPVNDFPLAVAWYENLFGTPPTFAATDTEVVWILAENRSVYVVKRPEHAGHAMHTVLVDDLTSVVARIGERGIQPTTEESYPGGMCKMIYHDPDGNEFGFGGASS